jgi:hypothetical protein
VATTIRDLNKIYVLNEIGNEISFLGKEIKVGSGIEEWVT